MKKFLTYFASILVSVALTSLYLPITSNAGGYSKAACGCPDKSKKKGLKCVDKKGHVTRTLQSFCKD